MAKNVTKVTNIPRGKELIKERRNRVAYMYFFERKSARQIGRELRWSHGTIERDLHHIYEKFKKQPVIYDNQIYSKVLEYTRNQRLKRLAELREMLDEQELTKDEKESVLVEIQTLKAMKVEFTQHIQDMQELGIIDKPKERHEVEHKTYKFIIEDAKGQFNTGNKVEAKLKAKRSPKDTH